LKLIDKEKKQNFNNKTKLIIEEETKFVKDLKKKIDLKFKYFILA
jgi:hypothetical protein